ncbi:hypothetical protein [Actinoplanes sp. NPDC049599]|uniref:hypothetical protein n=1 Tax=Actinoplanes sp. NPDC049599 TaxID=3363903 RepID=UPI0037953275
MGHAESRWRATDFAFSDRAGQGIGRGVGDEVLATRLLRADGPTHVGSCPR